MSKKLFVFNVVKLKRRQVITATAKRRQPKRRHIIWSQVKTATTTSPKWRQTTRLSVIANRVIGLYSVYCSVVKLNTKANVATVLMHRVTDEL